jgi:hypothetical protein
VFISVAEENGSPKSSSAQLFQVQFCYSHSADIASTIPDGSTAAVSTNTSYFFPLSGYSLNIRAANFRLLSCSLKRDENVTDQNCERRKYSSHFHVYVSNRAIQ